MQKGSPNQKFNDGKMTNRESFLSFGEWLDKDTIEHSFSEAQPSARHVLTDINRTDARGPRVLEEPPGLSKMQDVVTQKQSKQTESDAISVLWHELISPLTLIKGYTGTLLQLDDLITDEQRQQYLRGIDSASNRMVRLLEELRDVSRLEETSYLAAQSFSLRDLLREVVSEMQNQTTTHVIRLHAYAPLPRIKADPEKIVQVVNNLLVNAIKYSPDGGDIEVELRLFRNYLDLNRAFRNAPLMKFPCLVVSIADSGIGIPEAELERIFEKFYRVNNKLTHAVPGVGLGLYICKMIVEAHGGQIWAMNGPTGGSIFSFSLPAG